MPNKIIPALLFLIAPLFGLAQDKSCPCFLATDNKGVLDVEKIIIEDGKVEIIADPTVIAPVFSMGPGMNGDMVKKEKRGGMIVAQCKDGKLKLKSRSPEGTERPFPDMDLAELRKYDIRVNITAGSGTKKAFLIRGYDQVQEDSGPVIDMFGGKVPAGPGDFLLTTETKAAAKTASLSGTLPFRLRDGWMIVPISFSGKAPALFVVDLAATSSVIDASALPDGATINPVEMVEYNAGTETRKPVSLQGATGSTSTDNFVGKALLEKAVSGGLALGSLHCTVLKTFPKKLWASGIMGILGNDVLKRAGAMTIRFIHSDSGKIVFGPEPALAAAGKRIPFTVAGGLFFAEGTLAGHPLRYLLDTGARESLLSESFASQHQLKFPVLDPRKTITGIDGKPQPAKIVRVPSYQVGSYVFENAPMVQGDIAALHYFGLQSGTAILGMDFFRKFSHVALNFGKGELLLD